MSFREGASMHGLPFLYLLSLLAAAAPPSPIPPQVAAHVRNGHFDPGDYEWARGVFPGATPEQAADWKAIANYTNHCGGTPPPGAEAQLAARGFHPSTLYWRRYADDVCAEAGIARRTVDGFHDWDSYRRAFDTVRPYYRTYLLAVETAVQTAPSNIGSLRDQLNAIILPDQMLRYALSWGQGAMASAPTLDPDARRLMRALLWRPIRFYDHRNTAWLKALVAKQGWPTISEVGTEAASHAWLLVQHADDDPLFQLKALRLTEPLVARNEVDKRDYGFLYDRVMLPLAGKQRYGTQFTCDKTGRHPMPLEDEAHVDQRRAGLGLSPISDYAKQLEAAFGKDC